MNAFEAAEKNGKTEELYNQLVALATALVFAFAILVGAPLGLYFVGHVHSLPELSRLYIIGYIAS